MVKPRENRVPIMMSDEELRLIDDWRSVNRIATRSNAVRRLCQLAVRMSGRTDPLAEESHELVRKIFVVQSLINDLLKSKEDADWKEVAKIAMAGLNSIATDSMKLSAALRVSARQASLFAGESTVDDAMASALENKQIESELRQAIERDDLDQVRKLWEGLN